MASRVNKNKVIAAAQKYVQKGQLDRAIREYRRIVDEDPRDVRIWLKIGDLFAKKGSRAEAVDTYLKVAEFYSEQGFYLKAVAVYKQILRLDPSLVDVNLRLAELYKQLGLLNDAMQQYERVSNYYNSQGRTRDALAAVRQIVDLDPENVASRIKLAELYSKEQMRDEAIEEFSKAADFLRASNRLDDFVKVAERLVYHQPDAVGVIKELASLYLRRNDPRRALQKLQVAFKADPRDEATLAMLAQAFEDLDQIAKTVSVLKELAHVYGDTGQDKRRLETFQRILELVPSDADALAAIGGGAPSSRAAETASRAAPHPADAVAQTPLRPLDAGPGPASSEIAVDVSLPDDDPFDGPTGVGSHADIALDDGLLIPGADRSGMRQPPQRVEVEAPSLDLGDFAPEPDLAKHTLGPSRQEMSEQVARVISEADVYIKYGLHDKAIDHLRQIFVDEPNNVEVRLRLRDLHVQLGQLTAAAGELHALAEHLSGLDRRAAAQYLNDALELDPEHRAARELLRRLEDGGDVSGPREYPDFEDGFSGEYSGVAIDLDAADIVEEIPLDASDLVALDRSAAGTDAEAIDFDDLGSGIIEIHSEETGVDELQAHVIAVSQTDGVGMSTDDRPRSVDTSVDDPASIADDLDEAEFFIQQSLFTEARAILEDLDARCGGANAEVASKLASLNDAEARAGVMPHDAVAEHVDLAAELAAELEESDSLEAAGHLPVEFSVEDVFDEFKRGVDSHISEEDSETHYDLGIAYREMGLLDDAITEFRVAMRSPDKEVLCHMMIGLCQSEKGQLSEAISEFKAGLYVEGITEREAIALYFELGQAYETLSDPREALYYFEKVSKKDPGFRDVEKRIAKLHSQSDDRPSVGGRPSGGRAVETG
ncbi:MAG: tetratricopeptide repeat protein [Deltaproteobacteria bacterium]|nr:tetratricopeptide repeat protein [Deltaproteobacteria bacterium]